MSTFLHEEPEETSNRAQGSGLGTCTEALLRQCDQVPSHGGLIDLSEGRFVVHQPFAETAEIVRVPIHGVLREPPLHTQVLNVVIQRIVELDGHTTRYHKPMKDHLFCARM